MPNYYWVGSRESDILHTSNLFSGSITLYGFGARSLTVQRGARIDNNAASRLRDEFILKNIAEVAASDPDARFYFYDPSWAYEIEGLEAYRDRFVCVNSAPIYQTYNNKISFHDRMKDKVPMLHKAALTKGECDYRALCARFQKRSGEFIVQAPVSNGGNGTYLLNGRNARRIAGMLDESKRYLVSEYYSDNVPVNIHFLISEREVVGLPASIQILRRESDRLIYRGADYAAYRTVQPEKRSLFEEYAREVAVHMQREGYRGVCGIDGVITEGGVFIVEFNSRFQGSTAAINFAFEEQGIPSVQALNLAAFEGKPLASGLEAVSVNYSTYTFLRGATNLFANHILQNCDADPYVAEVNTDGYSPESRLRAGIYMFRILVRGNLTCVNEDGGTFLHENIVEPDIRLYRKAKKRDRLAVKILLMSLGVKFTQRALSFLLANGGIRPGNNNAVDLNVLDMVVNAPRDIKFIAFTPFSIDIDGQNELTLYYYGSPLTEVSLYPLDPLSEKVTSNGVAYEAVAYLSTDRLRIHMTNECIFKRENVGCKFCNIVPCASPLSLEDIREVIEDYCANSPAVRHFLVGGQSMDQASGMKRIADIVRIIRSYTKEKHVYVMALPYDEEAIKTLVEAGMDELACNIEIFDPELAKKYMPGKGAIPRSTYYKVLSYARSLLPENGAVRAMLIYGLERRSTFIGGIKKLASMGIQPIISIFRPLPDTPLENLIAPPLMDTYRLYYVAERLCNRRGLRLGPACVFCQNNTLSLPAETNALPLEGLL